MRMRSCLMPGEEARQITRRLSEIHQADDKKDDAQHGGDNYNSFIHEFFFKTKADRQMKHYASANKAVE